MAVMMLVDAPLEAADRVARRGTAIVREGPSPSDAAIAVLDAGERARFLGERDGWTEVALRDGRRGWVPSAEIAAVIEATAPSAAPRGAAVDGELAALHAELERLRTEHAASLGRVREEIEALNATLERAAVDPRAPTASTVPAWPVRPRLIEWGAAFVAGLAGGVALQRRRARRERSLRF